MEILIPEVPVRIFWLLVQCLLCLSFTKFKVRSHFFRILILIHPGFSFRKEIKIIKYGLSIVGFRFVVIFN